jgi:hypothetical protein
MQGFFVCGVLFLDSAISCGGGGEGCGGIFQIGSSGEGGDLAYGTVEIIGSISK